MGGGGPNLDKHSLFLRNLSAEAFALALREEVSVTLRMLRLTDPVSQQSFSSTIQN